MKQQAVWALHGLCCTSNTIVSLYFVRKPTPKKSGINTSYNPIKTVFTFLCLILFIYFFLLFPFQIPARCLSEQCIYHSQYSRLLNSWWMLWSPAIQNRRGMHSTGQGCSTNIVGLLSDTTPLLLDWAGNRGKSGPKQTLAGSSIHGRGSRVNKAGSEGYFCLIKVGIFSWCFSCKVWILRENWTDFLGNLSSSIITKGS